MMASDLIPEEATRAAIQKLPTLVLRAQTQRALEAAAPLIVARELDAQARQLRLTAGAFDNPAMGTPASGMVVVLNDLAEDMELRASVLRGEGQTQ